MKPHLLHSRRVNRRQGHADACQALATGQVCATGAGIEDRATHKAGIFRFNRRGDTRRIRWNVEATALYATVATGIFDRDFKRISCILGNIQRSCGTIGANGQPTYGNAIELYL